MRSWVHLQRGTSRGAVGGSRQRQAPTCWLGCPRACCGAAASGKSQSAGLPASRAALHRGPAPCRDPRHFRPAHLFQCRWSSHIFSQEWSVRRGRPLNQAVGTCPRSACRRLAASSVHDRMYSRLQAGRGEEGRGGGGCCRYGCGSGCAQRVAGATARPAMRATPAQTASAPSWAAVPQHGHRPRGLSIQPCSAAPHCPLT